MHHLRSIRRLALGALITGAAIGAVPALAGAATSDCTYEPNGGGVVTINDKSGPLPLKLSVTGTIIAVNDTLGGQQDLCLGGGTFATTANTNQIKVSSNLTSALDGYVIDQSGGGLSPAGSPEVDGTPELETTIANTGVKGTLKVIGTAGPDVIRIAGPLGGVNYGSDNDIDLGVTSGSESVDVEGRAGSDFITGTGNANGLPGRTNVRVRLWGEDGDDLLMGGDAYGDRLDGGPNNDGLYSQDGFHSDHLFGGSGFDDATADENDSLNSIEVKSIREFGRLRLAPRF
jgi:hypothetical protein